MIVHQTDYLETFFDKPNNLFIQNWRKSPENSEVFKEEMLKFVKKYEKHNPSKALWLHKDFSLLLDQETQDWAEKNVVYPCIEAGNRKFAFVVSKDVFSHLSIVDSFEGLDIHMPRHFASEEEALKWLINDFEEEEKNKESSVFFEGVDGEGNMLLKVKTSADTTNLLRLFKGIQKEDKFYNLYLKKFNSLTTREKEVLKKYANGISIQEISDIYNISIYTTRTHWRNIKRKLEIHSSVDAVKYLSFY
jgi:DNA-binding CsgD family transcriptional regulator